MTHPSERPAARAAAGMSCGLLLMLALTPPSQAEASGMGARARFDPLPAHAMRHLPAAENRAFRAQVQQVLDHLAAQPAIADPPAPVCSRVYPSLEQSVGDEGVPMATVSIGLPATRRDGRCDDWGNTGVEVSVNRLKPLFGCLENLEGLEGAPFCRLIALQPGPHGFDVHRGHKKIIYAYKRSAEAWMKPVSREEYLQARERHFARVAKEQRDRYDALPAQYRTDDSGLRQLDELVRQVRADQAALSPEDRARPACLPDHNHPADAKTPPWSYGRQCSPGMAIGRINDAALYAPARFKGRIETLVFETDAGRTGAVEPYLFEYKLKMLAAFDFDGLGRRLDALVPNAPARSVAQKAR